MRQIVASILKIYRTLRYYPKIAIRFDADLMKNLSVLASRENCLYWKDYRTIL